MKLDLATPSKHGSFSIEPTEGREIVEVFVDFETKLLIVSEVDAQPPQGQSRSRPMFVTTIALDADGHAARIISPEERKNRIDYGEKTETDEALGMKRVFRRELDLKTGNEFINEQLFELNASNASKTPRSTSRSAAFSARERSTIFDFHRELREQQEQVEKFWRTEYAAKSFEDRVAYWSGQIHRHMRWQSESGLDEYAGFTPEWYEDAKRRDPDFDKILTFMFFDCDKNEFAYQDRSAPEILRRIGRPDLAKRPPKRKR